MTVLAPDQCKFELLIGSTTSTLPLAGLLGRLLTVWLDNALQPLRNADGRITDECRHVLPRLPDIRSGYPVAHPEQDAQEVTDGDRGRARCVDGAHSGPHVQGDARPTRRTCGKRSNSSGTRASRRPRFICEPERATRSRRPSNPQNCGTRRFLRNETHPPKTAETRMDIGGEPGTRTPDQRIMIPLL